MKNPDHKLWWTLGIGVVAVILILAWLGDPAWLSESIQKAGGAWKGWRQ